MGTPKDNLKFAVSLLVLLTAIGTTVWISTGSSDPTATQSEISERSANYSEPFVITVSSINQQPRIPFSKPPDTAATQSALSLNAIYNRSADNSKFEAPLLEEVKAFELLLQRTIEAQYKLRNLREPWQKLGWEIHFDANNKWIIIEEHESQRRGRGLFAIRTQAADPIMVQAPHRFFDMKTGTITRKLFEEFPIKAAAWNTVHRKQHDIAHVQRSFFNAFTSVLTRQNQNLINIQIHGFDASKRKNSMPETLAIVSNATRYPNRKTKDFAQVMKHTFSKDRVWLFPQETLELGATTNKQASVMRRQGNSNFLHIEMSKAFREQLTRSADQRQILYDAFRSTIKN